MINLLPLQSKKLVKKELLRRFTLFFGLAFSFLLIVATILFSVSWFFLDSVLENLNDQGTSVRELAERKKLENLESEIVDLNGLLELLRQGEEKSLIVTDSILNTISFLPSSVTITSFLFDFGKCEGCVFKMVPSGHAENRVDLIKFVNDLEESGYFKKVELPVSGLLKERDINFLMTLELKANG